VDVQNTFNLVFQTTIFQELRFFTCLLDHPFPFVHWFYTRPSPLYLLEVSKHRDLTLISSKFGT
jgi:hypothetical protein